MLMKKTMRILTGLILLLTVLSAAAERGKPNVVGTNVYKKEKGIPVIQPMTYEEAYACMSIRADMTLYDIAQKYSVKTYSWSNEGLTQPQTAVTMAEGDVKFVLLVESSPFEGASGTGEVSAMTDRMKNRVPSQVLEYKCFLSEETGAPRDLFAGATIEKLLTEYGITEISPEGLIYDNDIIYADEGSEDTDFAYHPEIYATLRREDGKSIIEFTAYREHSSEYCKVTYVFKGEKIESVALEKEMN